jgi:drug/metabolite transporter (DMT)-like permease
MAVLPSGVVIAAKEGFWWALLANVLWGTSFLASKYTLAVWGPFTASTLRFLVAVIGLWVGLRATGREIGRPKGARSWILIMGLALTGFGMLYPLQLFGLRLIPSSLSASIMLLSPLIVVLLGIGVLHERASRTKLAAIALGILGGTFLLNPESAVITAQSLALGCILTIAAAASLAISVVFTKKLSGQMNSASITFWSMLLGLLAMAPFALRESSSAAVPAATFGLAIGALLYLALICSVACFLIWNHAIAISSPKDIASTMHVKTPIAILLGILIAHEAPTLRLIVGTLIVGSGVWLSQTDRTASIVARGK